MKQKNNLSRFSYYLIQAGIIGSICSLFSTLIPIPLGIWVQSEPVVIVLNFCSTIITLGILLYFVENRQKVISVFIHPFVLLPLLLATWSLLMMFFVPIPMRSLLGLPQTGEGVIWYFNQAVITAGVILVAHNKKIYATVAVTCSAIVLVLTIAYKMGFGWWVPYSFPDYLFFIGMFLIVIIATSYQLKWLQSVLICTIALPIIYISDNRAGIVILIAVSLFILCLKYISILKQHFNKVMITSFLLAPIIIFTSIAISSIEFLSKFSLLASMLSRHHLANISIQTILENPFISLTGAGWGSFGDSHLRHLPMEDINMLSASWEGLFFTHFHSHNMFVETFLSAGLIGLILLWAIFISTPYCVNKSFKPIACGCVLVLICNGSLWFQLPVSMPFMAIALACLAKIGERTSIYSYKAKSISYILVCIFLLQAISTYLVFDMARTNHQLVSPMLNKQSECPDTASDYGRGGHYLYKNLWVQFHNLPQYSDADEDLKRLQYLACVTNNYLKTGNASINLYLTDLLMLGEIAFSTQKQIPNDIKDMFLSKWEEKLYNFLSIAPKRSDLASPYILWKIAKGNEKNADKMASFIYKENPDDSIALWFKGMLLLQGEQAYKGIILMQKALKLGVENIIPIDPELKQQIISKLL